MTTETSPMGAGVPLLELRNISKFFGNVTALQDVSTKVHAGAVTCVLGDNGAGKSTFIKILSGLHKQSEGEYLIDGEPVSFESPRDARARGIATVYQDLAMAPLMSVWRNFFLSAEPTRFGIMRAGFMSRRPRPKWPRWASTSVTSISPSARCRVVSGSRSPSLEPSTTGRVC